jgi:hypothetical protein
MSLAIDVHRVTQVLLADGWHKVDFDDGAIALSLSMRTNLFKSVRREKPRKHFMGVVKAECAPREQRGRKRVPRFTAR